MLTPVPTTLGILLGAGVLVCSEGQITWRTFGEHTPVSVTIPRRADPLREKRPTIVNAYAIHKTKRMFFFLIQVSSAPSGPQGPCRPFAPPPPMDPSHGLPTHTRIQTEEGDLFKLTMVYDEDEVPGLGLGCARQRPRIPAFVP
jgi:splicing factor 3B subunit 3